MRRFLSIVVSLTVPAALLAAPAEVQIPTAPAAGKSSSDSAEEELRTLAGDLASPQFRQRQRAFERLLQAGEAALPVLVEAVRSDNREARIRALSILIAYSASRSERLAQAAQQTLDALAASAKGAVAADLDHAMASIRLARLQHAVRAIQLGGGTVTSDQGGSPALDDALSVKIGAAWQRGNAGLSVLAELPSISWLSLEGAPIDDAALKQVGQLPNLEKLYLKETRVRGPGLVHLAPLARLTHLSLRGLPVGDAALAQLPDLPQLSHLGLDRTRVTDAGLAELKRFGQLDTLWLDDTQVTDAGLAELTPLRQLRTLFLVGTKSGGAGLASLKEIPSLRFVSLTKVKLAPEATRHLGELAQIEILVLDHTNVTDEQLAALTRLKGLRTLWLSHTSVSDAGIEHLQQIKSLQMVYLSGSQVTEAGRQALRKALPDCAVEPDDNVRRRR